MIRVRGTHVVEPKFYGTGGATWYGSENYGLTLKEPVLCVISTSPFSGPLATNSIISHSNIIVCRYRTQNTT